jgi:hypothetical protein
MGTKKKITHVDDLREGRVYHDVDGDVLVCTYAATGRGLCVDGRPIWIGISVSIALPAVDLGKAQMHMQVGEHMAFVWDERLWVGCEQFTRKETLRIFKRFGRALGYDVED